MWWREIPLAPNAQRCDPVVLESCQPLLSSLWALIETVIENGIEKAQAPERKELLAHQQPPALDRQDASPALEPARVHH
jgi:hypothetical protein